MLGPPSILHVCILDVPFRKGEAFLLAVGAFLLTFELLGLQSLKALIRRTFRLYAKSSNCK